MTPRQSTRRLPYSRKMQGEADLKNTQNDSPTASKKRPSPKRIPGVQSSNTTKKRRARSTTKNKSRKPSPQASQRTRTLTRHGTRRVTVQSRPHSRKPIKAIRKTTPRNTRPANTETQINNAKTMPTANKRRHISDSCQGQERLPAKNSLTINTSCLGYIPRDAVRPWFLNRCPRQ